MIDSIQSQERNVVQCFERLKYCSAPEANIVRHQKRVKNLCQQHESGKKIMAQFLIAMGQCII
jgi:hypothetical protein